MQCLKYQLCQSHLHNDCHQIMENYYKFKSRGISYYVCPNCEAADICNYEDFYKNHMVHLGPFKVSKKSVFVNSINKQSNMENNNNNQEEMRRKNDMPIITPSAIVNPAIINPAIVNLAINNPAINNPTINNPAVVNRPSANPIPSTSSATEITMNADNTTISTNPIVQVNSKRKVSAIKSASSKKRKISNYEKITIIMNGSHMEFCFDVTRNNTAEIRPPASFIEKVSEEAQKMFPCKIVHGLKVLFENPEKETKDWYVSHRAIEFQPNFIDDISPVLAAKIENYSEMGSGWKIIKILQYCFKIIKISPIPFLSGRSFIRSPQTLSKSNATVNVQNYNDNLCFIYSILAIQKYALIKHHRERVSNYIPFLSELNYSNEDMPMKIKNIQKFENNNPGLAINVFKYNNEVEFIDADCIKNPYVDIIYRSKKQNEQEINLLLIQKNSNYHYIAIINLPRLLNIRDRQNNMRIQCEFWCQKCLHGFRYKTAYDKHFPMCNSNNKVTTLYKMPDYKYCEFNDHSKSMSPPFIVYADFESVLVPSNIYENIHLPASAGLLLLGPNKTMNYQEFIGPQCIFEFLSTLESIIKLKVSPFFENAKKPMLPLTDQQKSYYQNAEECYLCKKKSTFYVQDHCHITGNFLGASCNKCNLSRQIRCVLPVFFHNLKGYDMHHILKYAINKFPSYNLSVIPQTKEKFSTLSVYMKMRNNKTVSIKFLDSYQFLSASLRTLASNLEDYPLTKTVFPTNIINGKGVFPYTIAKSFDDLKSIKQLPPKWDQITDEDYEEAKTVWDHFKCSNLLQYMLIYMKLDIYLLADIFEKFRLKVKEEDGLEAANFISIPALSWATAIKSCPFKIELLQDPEMYFFFQAGIRGGMTFVNKHKVQADANTSLLYIDINNLYGWALSQPLPYGEFKWIIEDEDLKTLIDILPYLDTENEENGLIFEVDLSIPSEFHENLDQLPLAPINQCPPDSKVKKLLLTHEDKKNYIIHYRLLQLFMELGAKVDRIHRAISFKQALIFKSYIDFNSTKRAAANNSFEKDFYKLKNNSLYGKTVENLLKRLNINLCNTEKKLITYASKPQFKNTTEIADDLLAVLMDKETVTLDRPSYIGQAVLDLSKLRMYKLQYEDLQVYRNKFQCELNIIAGDTDSFFLECKNVSLRNQLLPSMIEDKLLDSSNFDKNDPLYSTTLTAAIGQFKDENRGHDSFKEWLFLRLKSYSLLKEDDDNMKVVMKSKGIMLKQTTINHKDYVDSFENGTEKRLQQIRIGSVNHQIYTMKSTKKALDPFDDKRFWIDKNNSLAYGHYKL